VEDGDAKAAAAKAAAAKDDIEKTAADRLDLINRLFAVAISVGFATQIALLLAPTHANPFDPQGHAIELSAAAALHWHGLLLLVASMFAVVGSWEGYHKSVRLKPLEDAGRFWVDIVLVFSYLILMLLSELTPAWFGLLAVIFALYVLWDIGSIEWVKRHTDSIAAQIDQRRFERSIVITSFWMVFAVLVAAIAGKVASDPGFVCMAAAAIAVLVLYRSDKNKRWRWQTKAVAAILPVVLLGVAVLYFK